MTDIPERPTNLDQLRQKWQVEERPFQSRTAVVGPLIAWLRGAWNSISTKWYVRAIVQQQNEFNRLTLAQLEEVAARFEALDGRLVAQDQDQSALIHDVGELTTQLVQTNRLLQSIDERLSRLEKG
ncbi:MAG: hypothetical protein WAM60_06375 [Candidatus Promineifilaceae bacterium]